MDLKKLFNPGSIAVIGASSNKKKLGWQVLNNIQEGGFSGRVYPINLKHKKVNGLTAYRDVLDIEEEVDLAVVIIPAPAVPKVVENCAEKGIKNMIIISAGFSEAGREGRQREEKIRELAREHDLNILGPNCLGLINTAANINATFADFSFSEKSEGKKTAFISQSGAIGSAFFDWGRKEGVGIDYFVSVGNKAVLDENDLMDYFSQEDEVGVVAAYLEEIARGKRFMEKVSRLARIKPVVVLKAGRTEAGGKATMSHTGSLAGSERAVETGLKRSGAIVVENLEELFYMIKFLRLRSNKKANAKDGREKRLHIISNAGGPLVISVDEAARRGLDIPELSSSLRGHFKKEMPELTSYHNPLDILGDADGERYKKALEAVAKEKDVSNILVLLTPQTSTEVKKTARIVNKAAADNPDKVIMTSFIGGGSLSEAKEELKKGKTAYFDYPNQAIFSLAKYAEYKREAEGLRPYKYSAEKEVEGEEKHWDFLESLDLLQKYDIPTAPTETIEKDKDLKHLDYPITLKMVGREIVHKTEEKAVAVGLNSEKEARAAFKDLQKRFSGKGYCVAQPFLSSGVEMILGFKRDESFGAVVMVGWGGIYTEVLKDIETEADDVCKTRAKRAIERLRVYPLLKGTRGEKGYSIDGLAEAMVGLGRLARREQAIQELDINPLFVQEGGCAAADVRIIGK